MATLNVWFSGHNHHISLICMVVLWRQNLAVLIHHAWWLGVAPLERVCRGGNTGKQPQLNLWGWSQLLPMSDFVVTATKFLRYGGIVITISGSSNPSCVVIGGGVTREGVCKFFFALMCHYSLHNYYFLTLFLFLLLVTLFAAYSEVDEPVVFIYKM